MVKRKIQPASIGAQKAWGGFPLGLKRELSGMLPDYDGDNVPNGFDCVPTNRRKQESFLPQDAQFLATHSKFGLGKYLGKGCVGEVREMRGNKNLIIKTTRSYEGATDVVSEIKDGKFAKRELKKESDDFIKYKLEKEPLFIPTKTVKIGADGRMALIRPKVHVLVEYYPHFKVSNKQLVKPENLVKLRNDLIDLSKKGYVFEDGLQLGIDDVGRILMYDIGFLRRDSPGSDRAFQINDMHWNEFISEFAGGVAKYGHITKYPTKKKELGIRRPMPERKR
jgi:hypothetical protein